MTTDPEALRAEHEAVFSDSACPVWARESIDRYAKHGVPTGDFLHAVLANDLSAAVGRADVESGRVLAAIVSYVYRHLPAQSHGSYEVVDEWLLMNRRTKQDQLEQAALLQGDD